MPVEAAGREPCYVRDQSPWLPGFNAARGNSIYPICKVGGRATARAELRDDFPSRKDAARHFKAFKYPGILFSMLDGKDYSEAIWRIVYQKAAKAFTCDGVAVGS